MGGLSLHDVNFSQMGFPEMAAAFGTEGIDGGIVAEPFVSRIVSDGSGVRCRGTLVILGHTQQVGVVVYGEQFASNQDLGRRWMTAYIRGVRDCNDAFGPEKKDRDLVVLISLPRTINKRRPACHTRPRNRCNRRCRLEHRTAAPWQRLGQVVCEHPPCAEGLFTRNQEVRLL
jgi:hypothetical protein